MFPIHRRKKAALEKGGVHLIKHIQPTMNKRNSPAIAGLFLSMRSRTAANKTEADSPSGTVGLLF